MKELRFRVEVETVAQTRLCVATAIQSVVGGTVEHVGRPLGLDPYEVLAADGRCWRVVADSSLSADHRHQAEVVSPFLTYADIPTLQEVVRAVRRARARVDGNCGIHVHVDANHFDSMGLRTLLNIVDKQERLIEPALGVAETRRKRWCRSDAGPLRNDSSQYPGLNLHKVWLRNVCARQEAPIAMESVCVDCIG